MSPQYISDLTYVRTLAQRRGVTFEYYTHAEIEMANDDISRLDVQNALENCFSVEEQIHEETTRYLVKGVDTDERKISVVIEIEEEIVTIIVVTTWR